MTRHAYKKPPPLPRIRKKPYGPEPEPVPVDIQDAPHRLGRAKGDLFNKEKNLQQTTRRAIWLSDKMKDNSKELAEIAQMKEDIRICKEHIIEIEAEIADA